MTAKMIETSHHLIQREPDGEFYCSRCGLYSPSEEEQPCVPVHHESVESLEKAA